MYHMNENGRSSTYAIRTSDRRRAATWRRIFGSDRLPVLAAAPRRLCDRDGERLVHDLDMSRVHPVAVCRLAAHVARRTRQPYSVVLLEIQSRGFWVDAENVMVEETAVGKRPFFLWPTGAHAGWAIYA
jgi:hypothetical protein